MAGYGSVTASAGRQGLANYPIGMDRLMTARWIALPW
jgi:hypothetical protein